MIFNVIIGEKPNESYKRLLFADWNNDYGDVEWKYYKIAPSLEELFVDLGIATSKGDSRRRNKSGEIPKGYSEHKKTKPPQYLISILYQYKGENKYWEDELKKELNN